MSHISNDDDEGNSDCDYNDDCDYDFDYYDCDYNDCDGDFEQNQPSKTFIDTYNYQELFEEKLPLSSLWLW